MKRNLLLLFALVAFISARADKDIYQDQLLFHCFDDGTAEVRRSDYHDTREMDIVIPETVEADGKTYTVTSIGDEVFGYEINSITLPNTIRRKDIRHALCARCLSGGIQVSRRVEGLHCREGLVSHRFIFARSS
ncbi:MAG: hypothetical protein SPG55_01095 [Prevotella sp.]|nr:hypothetical protein [Prevotellaceae bacterium]MDY5342799.1 hypothetical protein [Prevotella sp.]